jgi:hypothetical protein
MRATSIWIWRAGPRWSDANRVFVVLPPNQAIFLGPSRTNCAVPFSRVEWSEPDVCGRHHVSRTILLG